MIYELRQEDFQRSYRELTASVRCHCVFTTELIGGQPADRLGVERFVEHQLLLTGEAAEKAVQRILTEELGKEKDVTPEGGEVQEALTYGVNMLRRTGKGPWIGNWQIKACIKQAASRLGIFVKERGSKGDMSETGLVVPMGDSLQEPAHLDKVFLRHGKDPAKTYWKQFKGRVQSPKGAASIVHDSECVPEGTHFFFEYRFLPGKLKLEQVRDIFAAARVCGLGSAKTYERGKFEIEKCEVEFPDKKMVDKEEKKETRHEPKKEAEGSVKKHRFVENLQGAPRRG